MEVRKLRSGKYCRAPAIFFDVLGIRAQVQIVFLRREYRHRLVAFGFVDNLDTHERIPDFSKSRNRAISALIPDSDAGARRKGCRAWDRFAGGTAAYTR